jgi:multiple sugar transport system substrate-binding protein
MTTNHDPEDPEPTATDGDDTASDAGEYSRRGFMRTAAAAGVTAGGAGLAGCGGDGGDGGDGGSDGGDGGSDGGDGGSDGGDGGDGGSDGGDGGSDGTSEQDFLWWTMRGYIPAETEAIRETAAGFEDAADQNVNLSTEVITWDSVFQEWEAGLQGRSLPNVSEAGGEHIVNFGHQGAAEPVTDVVEQYDDWYSLSVNEGRYDGDIWGMPWFMELRTSHVNTDMLEEAGVDGPPETWEEIITKGQTVTEELDVTAGWTTPGAQDLVTGQNVSAFNNQAGGAYYGYEDGQWSVEVDSAATLFTHLWTLSLREQWDVAPGGWGGVNGDSTTELYLSGETPVVHMPSDAARTLVDPLDGVNSEYSDIATATELTAMPAGPTGESHSFAGVSVLGSFTDNASQYAAGSELSAGFVDYFTQPETLNQHFPEAAPTFTPTRAAQAEMELFTNNPTEVPDSWLQTRLDQAPDAVRYGITDAGRAAPFLGALEGSTLGYSTAISGIIGNDADPKQALRSMGNSIRSTINDADYTDYTLEEPSSEVSLDDAPDEVQPWITGDGKPQIHNPYE